MPIEVILFGIITLVKLLQLWNALSPIVVTLSGIVTLVKLLQPENATYPISVTPSGIVYVVNPAGIKCSSTPLTTQHLLSAEANLPYKLVKQLHPTNAPFSIVVTLSGIVILVKLLQ